MTDAWFRRLRLAALACALALASGCGEGFAPYHKLEGFRVLAMRASRPALREGESSALEVLVFTGEDPAGEVRYAWSWCPVREPISEGGDCLIDEAEFAALLGLSPDALSFDLGSEASPELAYPGSAAAYRAACENQAQAGAALSLVFSCNGGFPISIRADVSLGEQRVRIQKELRLVFDAEPPNTNPSLAAVTFRRTGTDDAPSVWPEGEAPTFKLGKSYELEVAVETAAAESFVPAPTEVEPDPEARRENLFITWFITTGSVAHARSWFIDGSVAFDKLRVNEWSLPKAGDEDRDAASLYLVLRDERGGVDWLERRVELGR
jgi:hypothetical protein